MPYAAFFSAMYGLSGAGSRLVLDAVAVPEHPEWGALTGTVTTNGEGILVLEPSTLIPATFLPPTFVVNSGPCTLAEGGRCVGRWPSGHMPDEACQIVVGGAGGALGACPVFDIYDSHDSEGGPTHGDHLTLPDGSVHFGDDCPIRAVLMGGQVLTWFSDGQIQGGGGNEEPRGDFSDAGGGWQICF